MRNVTVLTICILTLILCCLVIVGRSEINNTLFVLICSNKSDSKFRTIAVKSDIGCCAECKEDSRCVAASVNTVTGSCWLHDAYPDVCRHDNVTTDSSWRVYEKNCMNTTVANSEPIAYSASPHTAGSTGSVTCSSGYTRSGSDTITCTAEGWSTLPTCDLIDCIDTKVANSEPIAYSATPHTAGSTGSVKCRSGYTRSGSDTIICSDVGSWSTLPTCDPNCPVGWTASATSCYLFGLGTQSSFSEAENYCQQHRNSHLVEVETEAENIFLKDYMRGLTAAGYWLGLTDARTDGVWRWHNSDTIVSYTNWSPGQPGLDGQDEDCALFYYPADYEWGDVPCTYTNIPICEISHASEPEVVD